MGSRLHDKWHRHNHWTYSQNNEPDAGHDPIASPKDPFQGDFNLNGMLSANAPLSAAAGLFTSNNVGVGAYAINTSIFNPVSSDVNYAGLYCYGFADETDPFPSIEFVRGFVPKALIVDGYADLRWPAFIQSVYTHYLNADEIVAGQLVSSLITAGNAAFDSLTANTFYVTTVVSTTTATATTTAANFVVTALTATDAQFGYAHSPARGTTAVITTSSSALPQDAWTLVACTSAIWDPFTWFTGFGTVKPNKQGVCICEFTAQAHALSGTPIGIVAAVSTNTVFSNITANPDALGIPFTGTFLTNDGVTFTNSNGLSGVTFHGTTFITCNGTSDEIGCYFFNADGQTVVDYMRLRVLHTGFTY